MNVIGYALEVNRFSCLIDYQVAKIGIEAEEKSGQAFLPVYKLAPLRILVTIIGVFLAFLFTLIPIPITAKDILRRDMGCQFRLLTTIYGLTQERLSNAINF